MGAFILAGLVFVGTVLLVLIIGFANGMSDSPGTSISSVPTLIGGTVISALILASHWMPHVGW